MAFSEWNSSPVVRKTTKVGKKKQLLTPTSFSLMHAVDFADRYQQQIEPALKAGAIVLADRYIYTAFARDVARGVNAEWVREVYSFAAIPSVALYFRVPLEESLRRIITGRPNLKYYEAGLDLGLSDDPLESYRIFQGRILREYERLVGECNLTVVDASLPLVKQQEVVREIIRPHLEGALRRNPTPGARCWLRRASPAGISTACRIRWSGSACRNSGSMEQGLPGAEDTTVGGKLIVLEGPDGVGRSTQVALLREWLEANGYAVFSSGFKRSELASRGIESAKQGHTMGNLTMALFYAADFATGSSARLSRCSGPGLWCSPIATSILDDGARARARRRQRLAQVADGLCGGAGQGPLPAVGCQEPPAAGARLAGL